MLLRNEMKIQTIFLSYAAPGRISAVLRVVLRELQCCVRRLPCSLFCLVLSCVQHTGGYEKKR